MRIERLHRSRLIGARTITIANNECNTRQFNYTTQSAQSLVRTTSDAIIRLQRKKKSENKKARLADYLLRGQGLVLDVIEGVLGAPAEEAAAGAVAQEPHIRSFGAYCRPRTASTAARRQRSRKYTPTANIIFIPLATSMYNYIHEMHAHREDLRHWLRLRCASSLHLDPLVQCRLFFEERKLSISIDRARGALFIHVFVIYMCMYIPRRPAGLWSSPPGELSAEVLMHITVCHARIVYRTMPRGSEVIIGNAVFFLSCVIGTRIAVQMTQCANFKKPPWRGFKFYTHAAGVTRARDREKAIYIPGPELDTRAAAAAQRERAKWLVSISDVLRNTALSLSFHKGRKSNLRTYIGGSRERAIKYTPRV